MPIISQVAVFASGGLGRHREHHPVGLRAGRSRPPGSCSLMAGLIRERLREIGPGPLALAPAAPAVLGRGRPDHPQLARSSPVTRKGLAHRPKQGRVKA